MDVSRGERPSQDKIFVKIAIKMLSSKLHRTSDLFAAAPGGIFMSSMSNWGPTSIHVGYLLNYTDTIRRSEDFILTNKNSF